MELENENPLAAAKGILLAIPTGLVMWGAIIWLVMYGVADARYDQYTKIYLKWQAPLKVIASAVIEEEGTYTVVFQAQVVNDSKAEGNSVVVMITAKLYVNGIKVKNWTENVDSNRHYCNPTLVKRLHFYVGDLVEVKMRADSSKEYPPNSVFILANDDRLQFDIN